MATTIDTTTIEGFDSMSAEDKVSALLSLELPDPPAVDMSQYVSKKTFDEKATEAANLSKKLKAKEQEKMTDAERVSAQIQEIREAAEAEQAALRQQLADLQRDNSVTKISAIAATKGFDKSSKDFATAIVDSDPEKIFKLLDERDTARDKAIEERLMKATQQPTGRTGDKDGKTLDVLVAEAFVKDNAVNTGKPLTTIADKWGNRN